MANTTAVYARIDSGLNIVPVTVKKKLKKCCENVTIPKRCQVP